MRKKRFTGFDFTVYTIATILFLIVLYPLILVVSNSFSDPGLVSTGQVWLLPKGFSLKGYIAVFQDKRIMSGYVNTIFYTVAGTMLSLFITLPAGYALTKQNMPGRSFIMKLFLLTMYVSGGLIPTFLVMNSLGLYNTRLMMILSGGFSVYNCIICRSFFAGLPKELEEGRKLTDAPHWVFLQESYCPFPRRCWALWYSTTQLAAGTDISQL